MAPPATRTNVPTKKAFQIFSLYGTDIALVIGFQKNDANLTVLRRIEAMAKSNVSDKVTLVKGLLAECPLDKPLDNCPAKKVRGLPGEKRLQLVERMDETELDLIISHHRYCFQKRRWGIFCEKEDLRKKTDITGVPPVRQPRVAPSVKERVAELF